jgi:ThiF family
VSQLPGPVSTDQNDYAARLFDERDAQHRRTLEELRADPGIQFSDTLDQQRANLDRLHPPVGADLRDEQPRWAFYPWRRTVVGVLGPESFGTLRLDRNRNMITSEEQAQLNRLRVGVVGLSVGHVIAHTLALQGVVGHLRLADFDTLELSNLNRVPATVLDLGVNKATIVARRIAELDPYLPVEVLTDGLNPATVDAFLDGLDVVVEECDSLDMKVLIREAARARGLPVLMSTGDRGLVDVERFDLEPTRPILHGLLHGLDSSTLAGLSGRDKIPHVLRFLDVSRSSARGAASMLEVNTTLTTWPQLAGEVVLGATSIVEAVRRIGLGEDLPSGRARIDVTAALDGLTDPETPAEFLQGEAVLESQGSTTVTEIVAAAAERAPSGGNSQPWHIDTGIGTVTVRVAPERTSRMDVAYRGSAVALGASAFNARVAAAAVQHDAIVEFDDQSPDSPLSATVLLSPAAGDADSALAALYQPMLARGTNRHFGIPRPLASETVQAFESVVRHEGAALRLITDRDTIAAAARIFAAADRIRYLTAELHAEMVSELRWPGDPHPDTGIDVTSLGLNTSDLVMLDILRRPDVMAFLAQWDAGTGLGDDTYDRVTSSSALAVVTVESDTLADYARGGAAVEAVWIAAQQRGLGVQPVSPVFLYAHDDSDLAGLSPQFAGELARLQDAFAQLSDTADTYPVLVLRLSDTAREPVRSRRETYTRRMVGA